MSTGADESINVALTADFSNLQTGMDAGARSVQTSTDTIKRSMDQLRTDFATLDSVLAKNVKSFAEVAAAESALDRLQQSNMVSAADLTKAFNVLDAAEQKLARESLKTTASLATQTEATAGLAVVNAGVAREFGVLANEMVNGNFHRMEGSLIVMANRANLLQYAFSPLGLAIGATIGVAGALAKAVMDADEREQDFNRTLVMTGGVLGITQGQFSQMADDISSTGVPLGDAEEALDLVAKTGRFTGESLQEAGQAAADMATVTGESMDTCVKAITKLRDDPVKALLELDEKYHFLKTTQIQEIQQLEEQGRSFEAAAEAMRIYSAAMSQRAEEVRKNLTMMDAFLIQVRNDARSMWEALGDSINKSVFGVETQANKFKDAREQYLTYLKALKHREEGGGQLEYMQLTTDQLREKMEKARAVFYSMAEAREAAEKRAASTANAQQTQAAGVEGAAFLAKQNEQLDKKVERQHRYNEELDRTRLALRAVHAAGGDTGDIKFDEKGDPSGAAWEKRKAAISQEVGLTQQLTRAHNAAASAAKKAAAEAHRAAMQAAQDANDKLRFTQRVNAEMLKEVAKEAKEMREQDLQTLKLDKDLADERRDTQRAELQDLLASKRVTAAQVLAETRRLDAEQLAADEAYYKKKASLDKGDVKAVAADQAAILQAREKARQADLKAEADYHKRLQKQWDETSKTIQRSIGGALKGMLVQGQSFGQIMRGLLGNLAEYGIDKGLEMLFNHQAVEGAKTASTVTGNAVRTASDVASTQTSMALTSQKGIQSILTSGAEVIGRVWSSVAAIPYVGPFLAPAMALAAGAAVYKLVGSIPSASGGWGQVPADTIAQIHKDEMVLPAELAAGVRRMANMEGGARGGGDNIHIHANDARTFKEYLRRNPSAVAAGLKKARRRGHLTGSTL